MGNATRDSENVGFGCSFSSCEAAGSCGAGGGSAGDSGGAGETMSVESSSAALDTEVAAGGRSGRSGRCGRLGSATTVDIGEKARPLAMITGGAKSNAGGAGGATVVGV